MHKSLSSRKRGLGLALPRAAVVTRRRLENQPDLLLVARSLESRICEQATGWRHAPLTEANRTTAEGEQYRNDRSENAYTDEQTVHDSPLVAPDGAVSGVEPKPTK